MLIQEVINVHLIREETSKTEVGWQIPPLGRTNARYCRSAHPYIREFRPIAR